MSLKVSPVLERFKSTHSYVQFSRIILALGLTLIVGLLGACTSERTTKVSVRPTASPTAQPTGRGAGDVLRFINPDAPVMLNPHLTSSIRDWEAARIAYEPLASFDKDGNLIPFLAAEIPTQKNGGLAADGKSVTWKLKQGIKWSDGTPFTADDVLFTYQFITNSQVKSSSATNYGAVDKVEVVDANTVKVSFKNTNPAWALPFVGNQGAIIPKHIFQEYNNTNARQAPANTLPVGTGPYRVISPGIKPQEVLLLGSQLVETNKIVFVPNPYFREADKPYFRQIEFRGGGTVNEAARQLFEDDKVDYAYSLGRLSISDLNALESSTTGRIAANFGARVERILLNRTNWRTETADGERSNLQNKNPFFDDKKVRQAFAYAIDRASIAALYGSTGRPTALNLVAPPQYRSANTFYDYDLKKAAALLDEAGWRDTNGDGIREKNISGTLTRLKVVFQTSTILINDARLIVKKGLESIGVEVDLKTVDQGIMFGACSANPDAWTCFNADMQYVPIRSANPDPSAYMQFWTCTQIPQKSNNWSAGNNAERWCNSQYDALYQQTTTEVDPEKRRQLFIQMNDMLIEDVVMIPVVFTAEAQGVSNDIQGVDLTPWDSNTWNIKDWRRK